MLHQPANILFTIPNFITAGSGQALLNIASRLDPNRFKPSIAVLKRGGPLESDIHALGIPLLELPFTVPARPLHRLPPSILKAARQFRPHNFQLWHSFHYLDDYTEPLIARASGARAWLYSKKSMDWHTRAWKIRTLLATHIVALNSAMLDRFFAAPHSRNKVRLIPRGVDTDLFQPGMPPRLQLRRNFNLSDSNLLIGCVAHLLPVKGQNILIRALNNIPQAHLLLAGREADAQYARQLKTLCRELNLQERVHFAGNIKDVPALLSELDVFVLPTRMMGRMEGCPVALLEALSSAVPCVASDIPGVQDVMQNGHNGLLFPPENSAVLAAALNQLRTSPRLRHTLGQEGRQRILQNYTIEQEVKRHTTLYNEVLGLPAR